MEALVIQHTGNVVLEASDYIYSKKGDRSDFSNYLLLTALEIFYV